MTGMRVADIVQQRLLTQRVAGVPFERPEDMVQWLVGVQSQDYAGARWSVGQRTLNCTDADVRQAFDAGKILRTHVLRPTWHFVTPADIRWMLQLTAPRVHALNAYQYRTLELNEAVVTHSQTLIADALQGGKQLTRAELAAIFACAGIVADGQRLSYIVMRAELDGLICSGALRGKQHTYALLEERAPEARTLAHDEALAELTLRFFASHGPVTLKDYARWSGLTVTQAKQGLEMVEHDLAHEVVEGQTYWFGTRVPPGKPSSMTAYLLPEFDECVLTYKDVTFPDMPWTLDIDSWNDSFYRPIIIDGMRAGTWRRTLTRGAVVMEARLFTSLDAAQTQALEAATERYGQFMNMPSTLTYI